MTRKQVLLLLLLNVFDNAPVRRCATDESWAKTPKTDLHNVLNKSSLERLTTLDKPHSNDMIGQRHGIVTVSNTHTEH